MDEFEKFLNSVTMCHTCGGYTAEDMRKAWEESARQKDAEIAMLKAKIIKYRERVERLKNGQVQGM